MDLLKSGEVEEIQLSKSYEDAKNKKEQFPETWKYIKEYFEGYDEDDDDLKYSHADITIVRPAKSKGQCRHLSEKGCRLPISERPAECSALDPEECYVESGGKAIEPTKDFGENLHHRQDVLMEGWAPYQKLLRSI